MKDALTPSPEFTDWLVKTIPAPFNWVSDKWQAMKDALTPSDADGLWNWLRQPETITAPFRWVGEKWQAMKDALTPSPGVLDWLLKIIPNPFQWVEDAWDAMKAYLKPLTNLFGWLSPDKDAIAQAKDTAFGAGVDVSTEFGKGIEAFPTAPAALEDQMLAAVERVENIGWFAKGAQVMETMKEGMLSNPITGAFINLFKSADDEVLPQSDARSGPFAHLTERGRSIVETMVEGMEGAMPMLARALENVQLPLPVGPVPPQAFAGAAAAGAGGNTTEVYMTVNEGAVKIYTQNGDPAEITGALDNFFKRQVRSSVEQADDRRLA